MSGGAQSAAIQATATAADQQQAVQVTVSTVPVLSALPRGEERRDFEVLVRVRAPTDATRRAPIDLVAVLDVSGSMTWSPEENAYPKNGGPSRLDLLKDAMKFIMDQLHAGDRLAIVAFNHNVVEGCSHFQLTEMPGDKQKRESLKVKWVDSIQPGGDTLFAPGLVKAIGILRSRAEADKHKRVGFIVFLSDGIEGVRSDRAKSELSPDYPSRGDWRKVVLPRNLNKQQAEDMDDHTPAVHTFGFSKFHDPGALHDIAGLSGGTYSFLNTGLDNITYAFALCLGDLRTVVAAGVSVNLTVLDPLVKITSIDAGGYDKWLDPNSGRKGRITIPVLYAGEVKDFIVHLEVPSHDRGKQLLLSVHGKCSLSGVEAADPEIEEDELRIERPSAAAGGSQPPKQNGEVIKQVLRFKILDMLKEFLDKTKKEGWDLKGKDKVIAEQLLGEKWKTFQKKNKSDLDEQGVMERYNGYVTKMQDDLKNGDGGAHVLAFDSSNKLQRVTTMGSPANVVPEFKTDEIKKMGGEAKKQRGEPVPEEELPPPQPPPATAVAKTPEERLPWPCACPEYDIIGEQLAYWSVVKRDLLRLVEQVEGDGGHRILTGTFRDLSLASINRAMYESVFLAVEHAHNLRSAYCAATGHRAVAAGYDGEERYQYDRQRAVP
ncbi:unnamed protein product [Urochloa decumbens]|uniref:VWFA domain-containing protein n=1 Tax=Urochloa decumbens TaxID=240449 RepID=A0ABC9B5T8_9POAL